MYIHKHKFRHTCRHDKTIWKGKQINSKHKNQDNGYLRWERQEYEMGQTVWKDGKVIIKLLVFLLGT